jgi:2-polyprenyl-3-methyl-5-hydroxy-6-metoxy-1,4-benzoquinol methylase
VLFTLARYKFVAKMLDSYDYVLEVGCGNGFGTRIVAQAVKHLTATDPDVSQTEKADGVAYINADILKGPPSTCFDAVYCLDVFEHIADEKTLLTNLRACAPVCIIGTPSRESQAYASVNSRRDHVNCKSGEELRTSCLRYWKRVFMFGMNDETLHTGFMPMSHYLFALCIGEK